MDAIPAGDNVLGTVPTSGATAAVNRTAAQAEADDGLQTCLNQWNDYAPSLIRSLPRRTEEERYSGDFRFDFRVTDDMTVYAAYQKADRHITSVDNTLNLGSPGYNQAGSALPRPTPAATSHSLITPRTVNYRTWLQLLFNRCLCGAPTVTGTGARKRRQVAASQAT